jgi:hypothetical protein
MRGVIDSITVGGAGQYSGIMQLRLKDRPASEPALGYGASPGDMPAFRKMMLKAFDHMWAGQEVIVGYEDTPRWRELISIEVAQ